MHLSSGNRIHIGRALAAISIALAFALAALAQSVTTTVQGTVYLANGQPATGTVQIQWPTFTTAAGQTITAGSTTVTLGSSGSLSVNLAPNQGATPAGLFYTVTYYLSNGATNTEYWVVPSAASATLAQVRSSVMPSSQAIQAASKTYVDQAIANVAQSGLATSGGTLSGPLYLASDPTSSLQAADKHYVDTAVSQAVPLSGATLTGPLSGPSMSASVNNVINVMAPPYNAKGDCATDDQAAIQAALNAAQTNASSNTVVYFPVPPGGCYLTSTLTWKGQSLQGEAGNNTQGGTWQGVTLKGQPGKDILSTGDPDTVSGIPTRLWTIQNIRFLLNDTVDASGQSGSFPHRWPGKWVGDGAITSGSTTLSSTYAQFNCGDIGQAVVVYGAGAAGANLTTTIASVSPCYSASAANGFGPTTVTLAAAASTTVTAAPVYIAEGGMTATQQIGNCAIAMDNKDGNTANWLTGGARVPLYDNLHNVNFATTNGGATGQNNSCAIWWQGQYIPYGLDAHNINITNFVYGVVWGTYDVNPLGSAANNSGLGQDYQVWDHGKWSSAYPWISFNGGFDELRAIQLYNKVGPQLLVVKSSTEAGGPYKWAISAAEQEQPSGSVMGFRIDGSNNVLSNTQLASNAANYPAFIDGYNNTCNSCGPPQTLNVGGFKNVIHTTFAASTVNNNGFGNTVTASLASGTSPGQVPTQQVAQTVTKGSQPWGRLSPDFIRTGNVNTPYMNLDDLLILPGDVRWNGGASTLAYPDATSLTGQYSYTNGTYSVFGFGNPTVSPLTGNTYNYVIGSTAAGKATVPATKITLYASVKCPVVTSYTLTVRVSGTQIASATPSCNATGYTVGSVTADLSTYAGSNFGFSIGSGSGEVDWAYVAVRPYQADYNGYQPMNKAGDTMTGPLYLASDPTTSTQAATKNYVDTHTAAAAVLVSWGPDTSGSAGSAFTANYTVYYTLQLYGTLTVNTLRYRVLTADNTANLYDFGIYSVSGSTATLVTDIGPTAGTTFAAGAGFKSINFPAPKTLSPGVYLVAMTTNCAASCASLAGSPIGMFSLYNSNATSGPSTGGQLPSTITGLTSGSSTNGSSFTGFDVY